MSFEKLSFLVAFSLVWSCRTTSSRIKADASDTKTLVNNVLAQPFTDDTLNLVDSTTGTIHMVRLSYGNRANSAQALQALYYNARSLISSGSSNSDEKVQLRKQAILNFRNAVKQIPSEQLSLDLGSSANALTEKVTAAVTTDPGVNQYLSSIAAQMNDLLDEGGSGPVDDAAKAFHSLAQRYILGMVQHIQAYNSNQIANNTSYFTRLINRVNQANLGLMYQPITTFAGMRTLIQNDDMIIREARRYLNDLGAALL